METSMHLHPIIFQTGDKNRMESMLYIMQNNLCAVKKNIFQYNLHSDDLAYLQVAVVLVVLVSQLCWFCVSVPAPPPPPPPHLTVDLIVLT